MREVLRTSISSFIGFSLIPPEEGSDLAEDIGASNCSPQTQHNTGEVVGNSSV